MIPLKQAVQSSVVLSSITQRIRQSQAMLETILPLLPLGLRGQVQAGPVDETTWCLFVSNPSVASKLRQLSPALLSALTAAGWGTQKLRLKIKSQSS